MYSDFDSNPQTFKFIIAMSYHIEQVPDCCNVLGEGPHWDIETQNLYLVDVFGKKLLRFDYAQQKVYRCEIGKKLI